MTALPPRLSLLAEAGDNESRCQLLDQWLNWSYETPGGGPQEALTISGGVITPHVSTAMIDTEGGAASDDLDRIDYTHRDDGAFMYLRNVGGAARKVRVRHMQGGNGQISLARAEEFFLDNTTIVLTFQREGTTWFQRGVFYGNASGMARSHLGVTDVATMSVASDAEAILGTSTVRLITPAALYAVLGNYQALIGNRALATSADLSAEVLLGAGSASGDIVAKITLANLLANSLKEHFYSGELSAAAGTIGNVAHGMTARPSLFQASLLNKTAEHGYNPGDEITIPHVILSSESRGVLVGGNSTDVFWRIRSSQQLGIISSAGAWQVITPANWRLIVRAWR